MNELNSLLEKILGLECWSMVGPSAGTMFRLDLGKKLKRDNPVNNDKLRLEQREFIGQYSLFVRSSGWRLFCKKECICHCNDSNENDGPMAKGLKRFEGKEIVRTKFRNSPAELMIEFSDDYRLYLSDWEGVEPNDDAYTVFGDGLAVTVAINGMVSSETSQLHPKA